MKSKILKFLSFNNYSIQKIISISFTLIAVICISIVGITFYMRYTININKVISQNNDLLINQVVFSINRYLDNMIDISKLLYNEIKEIEIKDNIDIDKEIEMIHKINNNSVVSIALFSKYGEILSSSSDIVSIKKNLDVRSNEWFKEAFKNKNEFNFSIPHIQNAFDYKHGKYNWVISISKHVKIKNNTKIVDAVILIDINFNEIEEIVSKVNLGEKGYVYIIDNNGEIIYHPRQQLIYYNLLEENNKKNNILGYGIHLEQFKNEKRIVNVKLITAPKWKMIGISPVIDIKRESINIGMFVLYIIIFAVFIVLILNMILSHKITMPIKELEKAVKKFEKGDLDFKLDVKGSSEIKYLSYVINCMLDSIKNLIESVNREHIEKRKSELDALQTQINPHFLYNTLDSVVCMIENEKYEDSAEMVVSLAKLFRISLSKGENIIYIKDELEHIKNYLKIQSIRYKNKFEYKINCDNNLLNCATIKLTIQPIVENAIYHGVSFLDEDGYIHINIYEKDKKINIDIIDNGLGMSEETCRELLNGKIKSKGGGSGIGIKNVNDRIKLYFGDEYGIQIYSEYDEGTTIKIVIPITQIN